MHAFADSIGQVLHGDCIDVLRMWPNACVDLIVTDPPYLANYQPRDGRRCLNDDHDDWLEPAFRTIHRVLKPDRLCASFYGWPHADRFMRAWKACGFRPVSHFVGVKRHHSRVGFSQSHHEVAYLLAKGRPALPADPPSDVLPWRYTGNEHHPMQKPVEALAPWIAAYSQPGDIVLDPFAGSGSTGIAARRLGRRFVLIEKDAGYCAAARSRLAA